MPSTSPLVVAILAAAIAAALPACQRSPTPATEAAQPPAATTDATAAAQASGLDLAGIDKSVQPGDDFNAYANGTWEKATQIPADRSSTGVFVQVFELAEKRTADLIQGLEKADPPAASDARKIADYYAAYMDEAGIEQRGLAPLQPVLDRIGALDSVAALSAYIGGTVRADTDPLNYTNFATGNLFGVFVARGLEGPPRNVATLMQGGLGMPDREYYLSADKPMAQNRDKYRAYIAA
jgi:putative endopeptidase